jgi:uncharacterized C2H2 Zn-finger protein
LHENTLKGSAERRKPQQAVVERQIETDRQILVCPFCDFLECSGNSSVLEAHVAAEHSFDNPTPIPVSQSATTSNHHHAVVDLTGPTTGSSSDREVCPQCGARFSDPITLVGHFETAHGTQRDGAGTAAKSDCHIS